MSATETAHQNGDGPQMIEITEKTARQGQLLAEREHFAAIKSYAEQRKAGLEKDILQCAVHLERIERELKEFEA